MNWTTIWQLETRGIALMLLASAAALLFRRSSATKKHLIWVCALLTVGCLPLLQVAAPHWSATSAVPALNPMLRATDAVFQSPTPAPAARTTHSPVTHFSGLAAVPQPATPAPKTPLNWLEILWLAVSGLLLSRLAIALFRAWNLVRRAVPMGNLQGRRIRLADVRVPATVGVLRPVVLMPKEAIDWPEARQETVICHEMAHIRRKDWLWQILAQAVCSIYPFNPLAWVAMARMRAESEVACDDLVIMQGHDPADYAQTLLSVARQTTSAKVSAALVGMARKPDVEDRITSVLDPSRRRSRLSKAALPFILVGTLVVGGVIAGVRAEVRGQIHFPKEDHYVAPPKGQVVDADGKPISDAEIVAMKFGPRRIEFAGEGKSDADGKFDLTSLPLGKDETICQLAAVAHGHGLGMVELLQRRDPIVITCGEPATLRAGFKTPSGDPAAGVRVYARVIGSNKPPLPGVPLRLYIFNPEPLQKEFSAITDSNGIAEIHGLPEDSNVSLEVDDDRYAFLRIKQNVKLTSPVTKAEATTLEPARSVEGTLTLDGKGMSGVRMGAQPTMTGRFESLPAGGEATTDANGHYRLKRLSAGTYNIMVEDRQLPSGWVCRAKEGLIVRAGRDQSGVDFALERGALLRGTVDADKETLKAGVQIGIYGPAHPNSSGGVQMVTVKEDGTFEAYVPSGRQRVYIMNDPDQSASFEMKDVDVPEGGMATVNFSTADLTKRNMPGAPIP